jgi:hypothetical protein
MGDRGGIFPQGLKCALTGRLNSLRKGAKKLSSGAEARLEQVTYAGAEASAY